MKEEFPVGSLVLFSVPDRSGMSLDVGVVIGEPYDMWDGVAFWLESMTDFGFRQQRNSYSVIGPTVLGKW